MSRLPQDPGLAYRQLKLVSSSRTSTRRWIPWAHRSVLFVPGVTLIAAWLYLGEDADIPKWTSYALAAFIVLLVGSGAGVEVAARLGVGAARGLHLRLANDRQYTIEVYSHYSISPLGMRTAFVDGQEQRLKKTHWNVIDTVEFEFGPNSSHRAVASFGRRMSLEVDGERVASL